MKRLVDVPTVGAGDKALAADIRAFVEAMPAVETRRDIIKRRLAVQFSVAAAPAPTVAPAQTAGQEKGAEPAAPSGSEISR